MSLRSKIQSLIDASNETTGESSTDLTSAVQNLVDGYGGGVTKFNISYNLATNIVSSNTASKVTENASYSATIYANDSDYDVNTITVTMGGINITSTAVSGNAINIASVTGDVTITATALYYPKVVLSVSSIIVASGMTAQFGVKLAGAPTQNQTISIIPSVNVTASETSLTFTSSNYDTYQYVTVTGGSVDGTVYTNVTVRNGDPLMTDYSVTVTVRGVQYEDVVDMTIPAGQVVPPLSDFTYSAYQGGTFISAYNGSNTNIKVPLSLDANNKLFIGGDTFRNNTTIQYLELETGIDVLSNFATKGFSGMTSLVGLKWRNSGLTNLNSMFKGDTAFEWWDGLTDCTNATDMTNFVSSNSGTYAFEYLPDLSNFTKLTSLRSAFYGCTNLKKVFGLPTAYDGSCNMTSTFFGCTSLKSAVIGSNVTTATHCLRNTTGALEKVYVYEDNLTSTNANYFLTGNTSGTTNVYANNNTDTWTMLSSYAQSGYINLHDLSGDADLPVIVTWGDSTTSPGTSWTPWPDRLQTKLGASNFIVKNQAVSGEYTTSTSARQGGNTLKIIDGFTIPASGTSDDIRIGTRDGLIFGGTGSQAGGTFSRGGSFNPCTIENVSGVMVAGSSNSYQKFTRSETGSAVTVPANTYVYSDQDDDFNNSNAIMLINLGINSGWNFSASLLLEQVQYMVDHFLAKGGTKYIVCGPCAGKHIDPDAKYYTEAGRAATLEYESLAAQAFGEHWLNLRTYGIEYGLSQNNLTATAEDTARMENGLWAAQLLNSDLVHPSTYGANTQMLAFYEKGVALGYWS